MRIVHLSCVAPPDIGGIGQVAFKEVEFLRTRGHEASQISLTTHAGFRFGNSGSIHALEHFVRDADAVHLHYPFYGTAGAAADLKRRGVIKKLAITLHMDATARGLKGLFFSAHRFLFQTKILSSADALIVSSRDYARHSSYRNFAEKTIDLPFGVDEKTFSPGPGNRARFGLREDQPVALFVGGMDTAHAFKGVDVLLKAMARLRDVQLLLVGDGNLRNKFEALSVSLGIADRCKFAGKVDSASLLASYRSADALVLPSVSVAEAFGLVAIEAQACGVPAIVSDLPGVRTTIADGETGILVPVGDEPALAQAILKFTAEQKIETARRCRERVLENFTWSKHAEKLESIYCSL